MPAVIGRNLDIGTPRAFIPLLDDGIRYVGAHGGRGSGKSHDRAGALIERAMMQSGLLWVCVREVQKSLEQSVKRLLENKIEAYKVGRYFDVQKTQIITPGNGLIVFQGMQNHTAESVKSLEGFDGAWVEEAQTLSQASLDLLRPTIRKAGSQLWFTWNPKNPTDPVDALLRGNDPKSRELAEKSGKPWQPPPRSRVIRANWSDNPFFESDTTLLEEKDYDLQRDPDKYAHIWGGDYLRNSESRVFRNWKVDEFVTPASASFLFGADWGMRVDPSVLIRCYIVGRTIYIDHEAYAIGCPLDRRPAMFEKIPGSQQFAITADGSWPDTVQYMQTHGFPRMRVAVKGPGSVAEGVEWLQSYDIVVHPRCRHVIDELTLYSFKVDPHTLEITNVLEDKKNHTIDSIRYALEGVRRRTVSSSEPLRI
jgi:phage terminase large subunit